MPRRSSPHPTQAELEVLNVLWQLGPSTVRAVHETLQADRQTSLTTTLKLLQVMTEKGLTVRDEQARPHRYAPAAPAEKTQAGLLDDLVQRAFGGSVGKLMARAVEEGRLSGDELGEIRKLIDDVRKGKRGEKP
ncbi:MAG: BlaI/MecI/CopY family transcriptional regulator [Planctomycetota bacterium]|jgi:predicted transcriptional regulator